LRQQIFQAEIFAASTTQIFPVEKQGRGSCGQETPTKHHGNMFEIAQVLPKNKRKSALFTKE